MKIASNDSQNLNIFVSICPCFAWLVEKVKKTKNKKKHNKTIDVIIIFQFNTLNYQLKNDKLCSDTSFLFT